MKRKIMVLIAAVCLAAVISVTFAACADEEWNDGSYDLSLPDFSAVTAGSGVSEDGWYLVFEDDFNGDSESAGLQSALNASTVFGGVYKRKNPDLFENGSVKRGIWTTSPEGVRWASNDSGKPEQACYWCSDMVSVGGGYVTVSSAQESGHECSKGICPAEGRFTSGIETRAIA